MPDPDYARRRSLVPPPSPAEIAREAERTTSAAVAAAIPGDTRLPESEHHRETARMRGREVEPIASEVARAAVERAHAPMDGESHLARGADAYLEAAEPRTGASSASMGVRSRPGHVDAPPMDATGRGVRVLPDGTTIHTDDAGDVIVKETAQQHTEHELASARARADALRMMTGDDESTETTPDDEAAEGEGHGASRSTPADPPATASVGAAMPEDDPGRAARARAYRMLRGEE